MLAQGLKSKGLKRDIVFLILFFSLCSCASKSGYMVASWYGEKFHGRPTASGEIFDMYRNTAAHKTVPLGTKLKVTNPENGHSVVVNVNDRGPFVDGRNLDLSYSAAKDIGIYEKGVSKVQVKVLGRDKKYISNYDTFSGSPFTIQVASLKNGERAYRLKKILGYNYSKVYIKEKWIKGERYYRLRVGKFSNSNNAAKVAERLSKEGYSVLIINF